MTAKKHSPRSVDYRIQTSIRARGRGCVVVPADFLDVGSRAAVDVVLHRLARKGTIRRVARGAYDFPKQHPVLGSLAPSAEAVAKEQVALVNVDFHITNDEGFASAVHIQALKAQRAAIKKRMADIKVQLASVNSGAKTGVTVRRDPVK